VCKSGPVESKRLGNEHDEGIDRDTNLPSHCEDLDAVTDEKRRRREARERLAEHFSSHPFDRDELWPFPG
jgi:hypothetical protein